MTQNFLPNDVNTLQRRAANPENSIWVQANAGTGKTKVLIDRLARLLLSGADPSNILALTFTKAAAAEMVSRLYERLRDWTAMDTASLRNALAELEGLNPAEIHADKITKARTLLGEVLETQGGLRVETIHAFAQKLLMRFPLEAHLPTNPRLIEGVEEKQIWETAVDNALLSIAQSAPDTLDAIFATSYPKSLAEAIKDNRTQLEDVFSAAGDDIDAVVAQLQATLNPTNETAREILERTMLPPLLPVDTIERLIVHLEETGPHTSQSAAGQFYNILKPTMASDDPVKRWAAYKKLATRKLNPFKQAKDLLADYEPFRIKGDVQGDEIIRLKSFASDVINRLIFEETSTIYKFAKEIFGHYAVEKAAIGALDNADLIDKTLALFTKISGAEWILYKLDSKIDHIMLDEAQDTSPRQWALLNCLLTELRANPSATGRPRTSFTVGDEKQSIYGFQGADPETFHAEEVDFDAETFVDREVVNFGTSFRSTSEVLKFVDTVLDVRAHAYEEEMASNNAPPFMANKTRHTASRHLAAGCVELWPSLEADPNPEKDPGLAWSPSAVVDYHATIESRLAARVADQIGAMLAAGAAVHEKGTEVLRPCEPKDFLILVEKRKPLMAPLVYALKNRGIPVAGVDRLSLQDDIGAQDCLNLMRFVLQPADDLTLAEILRGPFVGLADDDAYLFPLAHKRKGLLWDALLEADAPCFAPAKAFLQACRERAHLTPYDFLFWLLNQAGGWDKLLGRLGAPARDPINGLLEKALMFEADNVANLQGFLLSQEADTSDLKRVAAKDVNYVRIMSVHGAKGLEAPIVMLPQPPSNKGKSGGTLKPFKGLPLWTKKEDEDLSEASKAAVTDQGVGNKNERFRLFYVAMTRARDHLYIFEGQRRSKDEPPKDSWVSFARGAMEKLGVSANEHGLLRYGVAPKNLGQQNVAQAGQGASERPAWMVSGDIVASERANDTGPLSPSKKGDEARLIRPFDPKDNAAAARGTLIHALFEYLIPLPTDARAAFGHQYIRAQGDHASDVAINALETVLAILDTPSLGYLFDPDTGANEVPIFGHIPINGAVKPFNGRIDRLVETPESLIIVDYKSDAYPPEMVADAPLGYIRQLAVYRQLLQASRADKRIDAAILWTKTGQLMTIPKESLSNIDDVDT